MPQPQPRMPMPELDCEGLLVASMLEHCRAAMRGTSPLEAEVIASTFCSGWYELAPDLSVHPHPLGPCPPLLLMRALHDHLDAAPELGDVALALARTLRSFDTLDPELATLASSIDGELTACGIRAPAWSSRLGACELVDARFLNALDGRWCRHVTTWRHACGEQHAIDVVIDPWGFSHVVAIDVTRDVEAVMADLARIDRMHLASSTAGVERATPQMAGFALSRTVAQTFDHDLAGLRDDPRSLSLLTLFVARSELLADALAGRSDG